MSGAEDAFFKSPKRLAVAAIAAFAIPVVVIALLINYVAGTHRTGAGTDSMTDAAISDRLAPVASLALRDANAPHVNKSGEEVFKAVCFACHATGAAGAPKFGNTGDWAPRIAQGYDTLVKTALSGLNAMPPRGGTSPDDYSDYEIARAVVYMANGSGGHFADPPAPAAAAPASGAVGASAPAAASGATATAAAPTDASGAAIPAVASSTPATPAAATPAAATPAPATPTPAAPAAATPPAAGTAPATTSASADNSQAGKALYQQVCVACHAAGVAGAPKFGDKEAWAPRLKDPIETIYNYALHGKGVMPPKGGSNASDADVKAAVDYMVSAAK